MKLIKKLVLVLLSIAGITTTTTNAQQVSLDSTETILTGVINPVTYNIDDRGNFFVSVDIYNASNDAEYMRKGYAITDHGDETYTLKMNGSIVSTFAYSSISMSPSSPMFAAGDSALWYIIPAGVTRTFEFSLDELIPSQTGDYSWELNSLSVATAMDSNTLSRINLGPEFETGTLHLNANVPEPSTWTLLVCGLSTLALRRKR